MSNYMETRVLKGNDFARRLSGGQLKRLMAAGAILSKPVLRVMDEITTGIDDSSKKSLYKAIMDSLPEHTSVISILHDLELTDMHNKHAHLENKQLTIKDLPDPSSP
jgi:ABC-type Mn2+/Zn2+ transport system ATPase subunit